MRRVVVTGAGGLLGSELISTFRDDGWDVLALGRADIDLERAETMSKIAEAEPEVVVNSAAWTDVDGCARDPERAMRINGEGAGLVAASAARANALVVQISTNEIFEGSANRTYVEDDDARPINPYGASKLAGERAVAAATDRHLVIRTAWLYGRGRGFPARIRRATDRLDGDEPLRVVDDEWGNPTPVARLAPAVVAATHVALSDSSVRVLHLAGEPPTTRYDWAALVLRQRDRPLERIKRRDYSRASAVPEHAVLSSERAHALGIEPIRWRDVADGEAA